MNLDQLEVSYLRQAELDLDLDLAKNRRHGGDSSEINAFRHQNCVVRFIKKKKKRFLSFIVAHAIPLSSVRNIA